jgi:hypothetical protein
VAATLTTAGAASADTNLLQNANWTVWQAPITDTGTQACFVKHFHATTAGNATFGMYQSDQGNMGTFFYTEDGITWDHGGTLTMQIDGNVPWKAQATVATNNVDMLVAPLGQNPGNFVRELQYGTTLRVFTNNGVRTFTLAGSNEAITTLLSCVGRIAQTRTPTYAPLPATVTPVAPLQPRNLT